MEILPDGTALSYLLSLSPVFSLLPIRPFIYEPTYAELLSASLSNMIT